MAKTRRKLGLQDLVDIVKDEVDKFDGELIQLDVIFYDTPYDEYRGVFIEGIGECMSDIFIIGREDRKLIKYFDDTTFIKMLEEQLNIDENDIFIEY